MVKPVVEKPVEAAPAAEASKPAEEEVFTTSSPRPALGINVVGKIDLSALNQSTRPKRKPRKRSVMNA